MDLYSIRRLIHVLHDKPNFRVESRLGLMVIQDPLEIQLYGPQDDPDLDAWHHIVELRLVRKIASRRISDVGVIYAFEGLNTRGFNFYVLSKNDDDFTSAMTRITAVGYPTFDFLLSELRACASGKLRAARSEKL